MNFILVLYSPKLHQFVLMPHNSGGFRYFSDTATQCKVMMMNEKTPFVEIDDWLFLGEL